MNPTNSELSSLVRDRLVEFERLLAKTSLINSEIQTALKEGSIDQAHQLSISLERDLKKAVERHNMLNLNGAAVPDKQTQK